MIKKKMLDIRKDAGALRNLMFIVALILLLALKLAIIVENQSNENDDVIIHNSYHKSDTGSRNKSITQCVFSSFQINALKYISHFRIERNYSSELKTVCKDAIQKRTSCQNGRSSLSLYDKSQNVQVCERTMFKCVFLGTCLNKSDEQCTHVCFKSINLDILFLAIALTLFIFSQKCTNDINSLEEKTQKVHPYGFVFNISHNLKLTINVYHFSLKKYMSEIEKKGNKDKKHMVHEWARLESFQSFPTQCPVSALRLAQSGFYSTGKGVEAVCFSCGLKNEHWTEDELVSDLHKRLSPRCKFINGEDNENVPIHGIRDEIRENTGGACGGPDDHPGSQRNNDKVYKEQVRQQQQSENKATINDETKLTFNVQSQDDITFENGNAHRRFDNNVSEEIEYFPGIRNEKPKHPEYATSSERLSSYSSWPGDNIMKPKALAEAGLFSTGIQDLVRCFFCGGGMKSWEYGDSPWIEHARWFPTCAYLKLCKGEDFINLCQMSSMTFPTQDNFQLRELDSQQAIIVEDQQITDLNSIAAKRVFDMGYSQLQIEEAIRHIRHTIGQSEIKAQHLLEYLLNNFELKPDVTNQEITRANAEPSITSNVSNSARSTNGKYASEENKNKEERQTLKEENRILKEQIMCKICLDKDANTVFLPCGHLMACAECAHALRKCAVCRKIIQGTVRAYPA